MVFLNSDPKRMFKCINDSELDRLTDPILHYTQMAIFGKSEI